MPQFLCYGKEGAHHPPTSTPYSYIIEFQILDRNLSIYIETMMYSNRNLRNSPH